MNDHETVPGDVTVGHVLLNLSTALAPQALRWACVVLSFALTAYAVVRPSPWAFGCVAAYSVLISPLIWKRDRRNT